VTRPGPCSPGQNLQWHGLTLAWDELDQVPRREAFKAEHPGAEFGPAGDMRMGYVPYTADGEDRSITIRADSYADVLDALDEYFAAGPDG
jgi:hypothetical protein